MVLDMDAGCGYRGTRQSLQISITSWLHVSLSRVCIVTYNSVYGGLTSQQGGVLSALRCLRAMPDGPRPLSVRYIISVHRRDSYSFSRRRDCVNVFLAVASFVAVSEHLLYLL